MNTRPPDQPKDTTPYHKWMMDTLTIVVYIMNSIADSLKKLVTKSGRQPLKFMGKEIIMLEDVAIGMNKTTRTLRTIRADGKLDYYVSEDGRTIFVTQDQLDEYFSKHFTNTHRES